MRDASRSSRAVAVLVALGCVWGASFLFIKVIVEEVSPIELVAGRLFLGALTIGLYVIVRGVPVRLNRTLAGHVTVTAIVSNILPFLLIGWSEERIDSGVTAVLNSTMPIFTAAFAAVLLVEERFTAARAGGLAMGFLGVIVLTGDDVVNVGDSNVLGQLAVVAASCCYGAGNVYMRHLLREQDPVSLSLLQVKFGTLFSIPLLLAMEGTPDYSLSLEATLSLLALGVFGTGFGYIAYLWLIETTGSVRASLVTYVIPVVGLFLGWVVLDEGIGLNTLAGAALIVLGVASVMRGEAPGREGAAPAVAVPEGFRPQN